ncbi:galanin receptor type 2-like [Acanthaster planci]|uniref:Galanin receptor type 2-like n=1 Tax=Acanthaster planci TaxID=133434 RepID=A0A8B7Z6U3_ACAPL|nr:galanin receptor type 2-like [Acanthaster planci]
MTCKAGPRASPEEPTVYLARSLSCMQGSLLYKVPTTFLSCKQEALIRHSSDNYRSQCLVPQKFAMSDTSYWEQVQWTGGFDNETEFWASGPRSPLQIAVNTSIACLAFLGNGLVITVMLVRRRMFSSTVNRLILHQSIIDAITAVVFFLHRVVKDPIPVVSTENNFHDELICRFLYVDVLLWTMYMASTSNLVIISLDRFLATCYPLKHRKMISSQKVKFTGAIPWGVGLAHAFHFVFVFEPYQGYCRPVPVDPTLARATSLIAVTTEYLLPIVILLYTHARIYITLRKRNMRPGNPRQNFFRSAKENVRKIVLLVGSAFIICWTPAEFEFVAATFGIFVSESVYEAFIALVACNMVVNPIIYCFMYEHFRTQLKGVLRAGLRRNRVHHGQLPPT